MLTLVNFLIFFFWFFFIIFLTNLNNFFKALIYSESVWIILYVKTTVYSAIQSDLNLLSLNLFIIGFAALELSIGLLLMIVFNKNCNTLYLKHDLKKKNYDIFL